jgi:hypothetical protein
MKLSKQIWVDPDSIDILFEIRSSAETMRLFQEDDLIAILAMFDNGDVQCWQGTYEQLKALTMESFCHDRHCVFSLSRYQMPT